MQFSRLHNEHNIALQQFAEEKEVSILYQKNHPQDSGWLCLQTLHTNLIAPIL